MLRGMTDSLRRAMFIMEKSYVPGEQLLGLSCKVCGHMWLRWSSAQRVWIPAHAIAKKLPKYSTHIGPS